MDNVVDTQVDTVVQAGVAGYQSCPKVSSLFVAMVILINTSLDHSTHADT